jgi:EAL domain-containing protein (putative c-di-GMP-specific phosphodiesterase class I)
VGGHIGVALFPEDAESKDELIIKADIAMQRARVSPQQVTCFYEARMDEAARDRWRLTSDLGGVVERNELTLAYQVQKSIKTLKTTGYEALLRWKHPHRGMVSPADFIPLAEACGAIVPIGQWVLRTACAEAARWPRDYRIAVNLSPLQLTEELPELVHDVLLESGLSPQRLELEITESAIIGDKTKALRILQQIKDLGVGIALDDFGTGYSSLDTLRSFPFDKIKLDRSFVSELVESAQARAIIRAVVALGSCLHIPILAEGVETPEQLALLKAEDCDEVQGYLFGRPQAMVDVAHQRRLAS